MKIRVNLLCMLGATIGLMSLFATWIIDHEYVPGAYSAFNIPPILMQETDVYHISPALFLIGCLVAYFSPIGSFFQFTAIFPLLVDSYMDPYRSLGAGVVIALLSMIIVIYSVFNPIGINYDPKVKRAKYIGRLFTFSFFSEGTLKEPPQLDHLIYGMIRQYRNEPRSVRLLSSIPKCAICGREVAEGDLYCTECGKRPDKSLMQKCPICGRNNYAGQDECGWCGKDIRKLVKCEHCGKRMPRDEPFCPHCGASGKGVLANAFPGLGSRMCRSCGMYIERTAKECPYCGYEYYPKR
ncbi:MAG TPA: zinc ribbon domain-containing protein [Euryarchaeota archaeon]|nr:zinc ribbon domain-containing protein [Euryarchaeota archaeon]